MKAAVFLILSLFCSSAYAELNLTLPKPEYDPYYCEKYRCNFEREQILPQFKFNDEVTNKDRYIFYTLNVLDVWSTHRAISGGYAREVNPLLPDRPSLGRLVTQKTVLIGAYEYAQWLDNKAFVLTMYWVMGAVVANNIDIIIDNEY